MVKDIALVVKVDVEDEAELQQIVARLNIVFSGDCFPYIHAAVGNCLVETRVDDRYVEQ